MEECRNILQLTSTNIPGKEIGDKVGEMSLACKTKHYSTARARSCLMSALRWCLSCRFSLQKMTVFGGMTRHLSRHKGKYSPERGVGTGEKCHKLVKQNSIV